MGYAGRHLLVDIWQAKRLDDLDLMKQALTDAASACGATLRELHLFRFEEGGGIAGVAMLMQSHISVHSWPEYGYAAFDAYVCGDADPDQMVPVLKKAFDPEVVQVKKVERGVRA